MIEAEAELILLFADDEIRKSLYLFDLVFLPSMSYLIQPVLSHTPLHSTTFTQVGHITDTTGGHFENCIENLGTKTLLIWILLSEQPQLFTNISSTLQI